MTRGRRQTAVGRRPPSNRPTIGRQPQESQPEKRPVPPPDRAVRRVIFWPASLDANLHQVGCFHGPSKLRALCQTMAPARSDIPPVQSRYAQGRKAPPGSRILRALMPVVLLVWQVMLKAVAELVQLAPLLSCRNHNGLQAEPTQRPTAGV